MYEQLLIAFGREDMIPAEGKGSVTLEGYFAPTEAYYDYDEEREDYEWWFNNTAEDVGEDFEHLPIHESVTATAADLRGECVNWGKGRQPHRKGRKHVCNRNPIAIRRERLNTHRQMDDIWLAEMIEPTASSTMSHFYSMRLEGEWSDGAHLGEVNDELWWLLERENERNHQHWQGYHRGPMTEATQNCHGWGDRDPLEPDFSDPLEEEFSAYYYGSHAGYNASMNA